MSAVDDLMSLAEKFQCSESPLKAARELRIALEAALVAEYERGRSERKCIGAASPSCNYFALCGDICNKCGKVHTLPRSEREQDAEPVAWMGDGTFISRTAKQTSTPAFAACYPTPLYASPPKRKPLTDEQIDAIPFDGYSEAAARHRSEAECLRDFARAIERLHGISNE